MVYPFQHNNALEPANPHRGASSARSAQLVYRRHFSANPFGFAAQRGVEQVKLFPLAIDFLK